jgi:RecA/RadA recombinase
VNECKPLKLGGMVALIDAEHAFDPEYSRRLGLKVDDVGAPVVSCSSRRRMPCDSSLEDSRRVTVTWRATLNPKP